MSFWIFAILLMAMVGAAGYFQGAIRAGFSFFGILLAWLLAGPLGGVFHHILPWFGISNPAVLWAVAPVFGFWLVNAIVKYAAFQVHRKIDIYYKHKTSELEQSIFKRINSRVGLYVGFMNGALYLALISFFIFNLSYWTIPVSAANANQPVTIRLVNQLGTDLQSSGFDRTAAAVGTLPENFYHFADLAGFLLQNPLTEPRLEQYPGLTSLFHQPDMGMFFTDTEFTNALASGASIGTLWHTAAAQQFFGNEDLRNKITTIFSGNFADLTNYLATGRSAKYEAVKIAGNWKINLAASFAWALQERGKVPPKELRALRGWYDQMFANATLLATGDGDIYVKAFPILHRPDPSHPPVTELRDFDAHWTTSDKGYDVQWKVDGEDKFYTATATDIRLTLKEGRNIVVFDRQ